MLTHHCQSVLGACAATIIFGTSSIKEHSPVLLEGTTTVYECWQWLLNFFCSSHSPDKTFLLIPWLDLISIHSIVQPNTLTHTHQVPSNAPKDDRKMERTCEMWLIRPFSIFHQETSHGMTESAKQHSHFKMKPPSAHHNLHFGLHSLSNLGIIVRVGWHLFQN